MKKFLAILVVLILPQTGFMQKKSNDGKPKLVVGIVIDQMRYDYLYCYWDKYGNDGFKKLIRKGYNFKNTNYNYVPTYTAPGHASIYTGTTPSIHGIVSNEWFDRDLNKVIYCTDDSTVSCVGINSKGNKMSPVKCLSTSIGDELKISNNGKSKVVGIALKDRAAILPAGRNANGAYWMDDSTGMWVTSTFYNKTLPNWVSEYNAKNRTRQLLSQKWETILPINEYTESWEDNSKYERVFKGEKKPIFPHDLPKLLDSAYKNKLGLIKATPFGNIVTREMAEAAIIGENLGKDNFTDLLCVSFSSPDYIGHQFGPKSIELEDNYIRLDLEIAAFIKFLDKQVGSGNYVLFLTADHAAVDVPAFLMDQKISAGYAYLHYDGKKMDSVYRVKNNLSANDSLLLTVHDQHLFLNEKFIEKNKLNRNEILEYFRTEYLKINGVSHVYSSAEMEYNDYSDLIPSFIQNGFQQKRCGDLIMALEPGWVEFYKTGTTHGSPFSYDTHVPLIWYGKNIKPGYCADEIVITSIAPTISLLLDIPFTTGNSGKPLGKIIEGFNRK